MQHRTLVFAIAAASAVLGGCAGAAQVAPQRDPPQPPSEPTVAPTAAAAPRAAIATPNAATGAIGIVVTDPPSPCGPLRPFPASCEPAWRVRIDIMPEQQQPGKYALGPGLPVFAYRDAQGKAGGAWGAGTACRNLGSDIVGTLTISGIDATGISGVLSGAGEADGPFRAERCPACGGTGQSCTSNDQCCNDYCHEGRCQP